MEKNSPYRCDALGNTKQQQLYIIQTNFNPRLYNGKKIGRESLIQNFMKRQIIQLVFPILQLQNKSPNFLLLACFKLQLFRVKMKKYNYF